MRTWFTSLSGAVTLSVVAFAVQLARAFVDFYAVIPSDVPGTGMLTLSVLVFTAIFVGWGWALSSMARGSRAGLIATLAFDLLLTLGTPVSTLLVFCPSPCRTVWPLMEIVNWLNLISGLLAIAAVGFQVVARPQMTDSPA